MNNNTIDRVIHVHAEPTEPQIKLIRRELMRREMTATQRNEAFRRLESGEINRGQAGAWIDRLLALPQRAPNTPNTRTSASVNPAGFERFERDYAEASRRLETGDYRTEQEGDRLDAMRAASGKILAEARINERRHIEDGYYALRTDGVVKFYRVRNVKSGKWAGCTFVDAQASDEFYPIRNRDERTNILRRIAKDPHTAMALYGQELGRCGKCRRTLTDEKSRALGIGPVCRGEQ